MQFDRQITITTGASRNDLNWKPQLMTVAELYDRLRNPVRSTETLDAYMHLPKPQQDALKDVGGFVGGSLNSGRRKANAVTGRDLVTLDFDNIPGWGTDEIISRVDAIGCSYAVYSTRKHCPNKPRLRVVIPLDHTAAPDEYEPLARRLAWLIGIDKADPTTFQASRLMYWPSACVDSDYVFRCKDAPLASVDFLLGTYADWRNMAEWPQVPGAAPNYQKMALKQGDPTAKPGIVGAFCRAYDIRTAMDKFLPGIYTPCIMGSEERYTYTGGSTAGGAIIYDNGKFLYSHHATDPCSMQLVNAFDLVRLHLYGDKDDSAPGNTPVSKLPSYKAMCEMAMQDSAVQAIYNKEQFAQLQADFGAIVPIPGNGHQQTSGDSDGAEPVQGEVIGDDGQQTDPNAWLGYIQRDENGKIKQTIDNVLLILNNDPRLCGRFMLNSFSGRGEVLYPLPWDKDPDKFKRRAWADSDISAMYWYMEKGYKITKRNAIDAGLDIHAATHAFNEVQDFLKGLAWDGVPRLDTLFIDYLGADDSPYTRAVTRKAFVGAVARAMEPGCKFDNMLILCGPQGLGKSTLLDRMSKGWYNDSIRTFEGKEASELLQGVWLVEVAELDAFRKTDVSRIKQFLSLRYDRYRAAYGRNVKELPRCCVFFGTCNVSDFLQDTTGNRRFWPVDVGQSELIHRAWDLTDDEINQIWAEAKMRWMMGEPLFLTGDLADAARARQEDHREASVREGLIRDFVERDVPTNWLEWPLDKRRDYWAGACKGQDIPTMPRDRICAAEVWCELFNGAPRDIKQADTREINAVLASTPRWEANRGMKFGPYKQQRGYRRFNRQV